MTEMPKERERQGKHEPVPAKNVRTGVKRRRPRMSGQQCPSWSGLVGGWSLGTGKADDQTSAKRSEEPMNEREAQN